MIPEDPRESRLEAAHSGHFRILGGGLALALVFLAGYFAGGGGGEEHGRLPQGETSTQFLDAEVEAALQALVEAEPTSCGGSALAQICASRVRVPLLRLRRYYLPLTAARAAVYDAIGHLQIGHARQALVRLEEVERTLFSISDRGDRQLSREIDAPLQRVVQAKAAVAAGRADARADLEGLAWEINSLLLKGGLVLRGTALEGGE